MIEGIRKIQEGVWQSEIALTSGVTAYFVLEQLDEDNFAFWNEYACQAKFINGLFFEEIPLNELLAKEFDQSRYDYLALFDKKEDFENIISSIKKDPNKYYQLHRNIAGGITGFRDSLQKGNSVAYISKAPIFSKMELATEYNTASELAKFKHFSDIVMSVRYYTNANIPTVQHYGIFRNPLCFLIADKQYSNLSMLLHGFCASYSLMQFSNKKYMLTKPLMGMYDIFKKNISISNIHVGTIEEYNKLSELNSEENPSLNPWQKRALEAMKLSPPIISMPTNDTMKIFKQNSAVGNAFIYDGSVKDIFRAGISIEFPFVLVDLQPLAEFFFNYQKSQPQSLTYLYNNKTNETKQNENNTEIAEKQHLLKKKESK